MWYRRFLPFALAVAVFGIAACLIVSAQESHHRGRKYKPAPPTSKLVVTVLRKDDGTPIQNAAVIFGLVGDKGNMELKSNEDGKAMIDVLPTGSKVLVQVIAKGYQTYGGDLDLDKPSMALEIKLRRPGQQYSIYEMHPQATSEAKPDDSGKSADKPHDQSKNAASKEASKDESASSSDSGQKPDADHPQPK